MLGKARRFKWEPGMERRCSKFHAAVFFFRLGSPVVLAPCSPGRRALDATPANGPCPPSRPISAGCCRRSVQYLTGARRAGARQSLAAKRCRLSAPACRTGKADPAYARVIKLGAQLAGAYQIDSLRRRLDRRRRKQRSRQAVRHHPAEGLSGNRQEHPLQDQRRPAGDRDQRLLRQDDQGRGGAGGGRSIYRQRCAKADASVLCSA